MAFQCVINCFYPLALTPDQLDMKFRHYIDLSNTILWKNDLPAVVVSV